MSPGLTFTTWVWVQAVQGVPPDPELLRRWRLAPPRLRTREATTATPAVALWQHEEQEWPLELVAIRSAVTVSSVKVRCRRWGITLSQRYVNLGGRWPKRQYVLSEPAFRAYMARAVRTVWGSGRPPTSPAT